jgi:hypothetical protein
VLRVPAPRVPPLPRIRTLLPQVQYYNDHGILLGVHGAGFINCMFMRQGSAVIEVFPYHLKHTLYMRQAYAAGLTHFAVYATDPTGVSSRRLQSGHRGHRRHAPLCRTCRSVGGTAEQPSNNRCALYSPLSRSLAPGLFKRGNALFAYLKAGCDEWPSVMTQWKDNACRGPLIGAQLQVRAGGGRTELCRGRLRLQSAAVLRNGVGLAIHDPGWPACVTPEPPTAAPYRRRCPCARWRRRS